MNQTVIIPAKTINEIFSRLDELTESVEKISARLFEKEPSYGSDEWWTWSDDKALKEIRAGKGTKIHNRRELDAFFRNLKTA